MKRAGFTLIEVLVGTAIAILLAIALTEMHACSVRIATNSKPQQETSVVAEHVRATKFPVKKTSADGVIAEAWFDDTEGHILWLRSKDGDLVAVPSGKAMELLKKLIRRGRNP